MKKSSSKIKEDIAKLQEQLKAAEAREAERIGRLALKAGLGEIEIDDAKLVEAFEDLAKRFRGGGGETRKSPLTQNPAGASSGANNEA
ncbi:MAG: conjugal transfer protein TraC [Hoeflea sp.]|nr:conjugal transfer protein TraC [Hoeflea sp.]|tara:strand:- start:4106 stop:4369 length:264 start_codon:yes stop_codon:yes gene_type:complete